MANLLTSNRVLDSLPAAERGALLSRMQPVGLQVGMKLLKPGEQPQYAHFMTSGVTSVVTFMADGASAEVGLVGREGIVESLNLLGAAHSPTTAFIQVEGTALRMRFAELQQELTTSEVIRSRILESIQCQGFVVSQIAACNGLHEIEERLARWLLMLRDRLDSERFLMTQELLAEMLGARRTSVTMAAGSLQRSGLIEYHRGNIHILDRERLQGVACECYPIVRDLVAGLFRPDL
ncbi:MAG TPA: Crp/Fnr family transcriptional regulator [Terracidiphilus sp.]|nr:Crp/Fnr family transcriptional regulator [Terracidiphilus sp.]